MPDPDLSGATWFKSSRSPAQDECVEVALVPGGAGVRDSKDRTGGTLRFASPAWARFLARLRRGPS